VAEDAGDAVAAGRVLDRLATLHAVHGALVGLAFCLAAALVAVFAIVGHPHGADVVKPQAFPWGPLLAVGLLLAVGIALSFVQVLAGRRIRERAARGFCLGVAVLECLMPPFGTILGIATIGQLTKARVKALFR
jgi:hypothetical protein